MDLHLLKVFVDDIMVRLCTHMALANAHHEPYTDAQVNALIAVHAAVVSAHHTDHKAAFAESAEFKDVNIPVGEAYKAAGVALLKSQATGNIFLGESTGLSTTGDYNVFIGFRAGYINTSGDYNAFIGPYTGRFNTEGVRNTFIGYDAGYSNTLGSYNAFIGMGAGRDNTIGEYNVFIGPYAGRYNTEGVRNAFIGYNAGRSNTLGSYNAIIGGYAGYSTTEGYFNTFIGYGAGYSNVLGGGNVFIGKFAGYNETGSNLLYINNSDAAIPLIWGDFANNKVGIRIKPAVSKFGVAGIPEYADNAAAVTAGLTAGEFYRTGDILKIVH